MASLFPVKLVLLEYSPRERRVLVRSVTSEDKRLTLAPIHEDNQQNYVRVYEGMDNVGRGIGFTGLVAAPKEGD